MAPNNSQKLASEHGSEEEEYEDDEDDNIVPYSLKNHDLYKKDTKNEEPKQQPKSQQMRPRFPE